MEKPVTIEIKGRLTTFTLGGLQAIGIVVPDVVYVLLGFAGLSFIRAGISKV